MAGASSDGAPAGYDQLVSGAASYRDGSRRVFRVTGDRAPDMLQGLITADIREPWDGTAWPTLILTPMGRVLADAVVVRIEDDLLLDVPVAAWGGLESHFARYLPPRFAKLEPSDLEVVRVRGPEALARVREAVPELASLPSVRREDKQGVRRGAMRLGEGVAVAVDGAGGTGVDLLLPSGNGAVTALPEASPEAWDTWRVERGIPLYGRDVTEDNLPQETGLVAETTSFAKGCYTGQEVLARIHYRGKVNRLLRGLRTTGPGADPVAGDASPPLDAGDEVIAEGRTVGALTSVVHSPRFGWIGLGYVRREVEPDSRVALAGDEGAAASEDGAARWLVVELPFA